MFRDLQADGLFAFYKIGVVTGIAVVPAKCVAGLDAEIEGVIVTASDGKDCCAAHKQLHDFGARRILWHKDVARQAKRGCLYRQRRGSVARRGTGDGLPFRQHDRDDARAIFERGARVARIVFEPEVGHGEIVAQPFHGI